jgi:glucosamine-6-phosphate deaminase
MSDFSKRDLYNWCKVPANELVNHPGRKVPLRLCTDSQEMGRIMARELVDEIKQHADHGGMYRAIIPCGPTCWYQPFTDLINQENICLENFVVFHMDESLDWQGRMLPRNHPLCFRGYMEDHFYHPIRAELRVPEKNRFWLEPGNIEEIAAKIAEAPVDITYGGWGQDGHVAYNQARRHPFSEITLDELRNSTARIQENNLDTVMALAQRNFGSAYQFVPPMSVTLGMKQILPSKKIRVFSDTGAWKQTALRVALFGPLTTEYPMTLLQEHPDVLITATLPTAKHPISENPNWDLGISDL